MSTSDHVPSVSLLMDALQELGPARSLADARALSVHIAVLLIGQRTPEEIIVLADYLRTGDTTITR